METQRKEKNNYWYLVNKDGKEISLPYYKMSVFSD
jgi:hypothetical protein